MPVSRLYFYLGIRLFVLLIALLYWKEVVLFAVSFGGATPLLYRTNTARSSYPPGEK